MRKHAEKLRSDIFPAMCIMLTTVENADDIEAWAESEVTDILAENDPSTVAAESI